MANEAQIEFMPYPESLLQAWKSGDYSMLTSSNASDYIKRILVHKAKKRPGRRFFGEAFIASRVEMKEGWYNSFKWLTSDKWITGKGLKPEFEQPFHRALSKYIGTDVLANLQRKALSLYCQEKDRFLVRKEFKKPVAPDLWIIDKRGRFRFIESKLPHDTIHPHQLAGLALIKKYLKPPFQVAVSVVTLYPEGVDLQSPYSKFYKLA